jgi:uncharacterized protein (DUF58 family)
MAVPVPTKRFVLLVAAGFLIPLASITKPGLERFLVPYDLALFVVFVVSALLGSKKCPVKVTRTIDTVISVRKENEVKLILESEAPYTIKARVRDEAPETCTVAGNEWNLTLLPRKPMTLSYSIVPLERGSGRFRGTFVRTLAPLGLSMVEHVLDTGQTVAIYPNVQAIREFDLLKQKGRLADAGMRRSKLRGLGTEFESIRDYNDDDFRFVDWNATARRGKLMVRNFEQERNQAVIVCLDLGRHLLAEIDGATKLDHCLDAALMLLHAAEREHDLIGLYAFDDTVRAYVAPKKGRAQIAALLKAAHGLQPEAVQPNYASFCKGSVCCAETISCLSSGSKTPGSTNWSLCESQSREHCICERPLRFTIHSEQKLPGSCLEQESQQLSLNRRTLRQPWSRPT